MIGRSVPELEKKLTILYSLARLGPCTADQLLQFMAEYGLMDYFTLQLTLLDLEAQGQVARRGHPFGELLVITEVGAFTAEEFTRRIPASLRDTVAGHADEWRERFFLEQQAPAEVITLPQGKDVHLLLLQDERMLLEVRMPVPVGDQATVFLQRRWRETAYDVLQLVRHLLHEGPAAAQSSAAELTGQEDGSWLLRLRCDAGEMTLRTENADEADGYARRWALIGPEVLKAVLELLHLSLLQEE